MAERFAAIDVGTNSVLLTVAEVTPKGGHALRPIVERAEITRLGRGVDSSKVLSGEGVEATLRVLGDYTREALAAGIATPADIACVATSAARDATNGAAFLKRVFVDCGLRPTIIGGEREAELSYLAARRELGTTGVPMLVQDIGGGSTELVLGTEGKPSLARSLAVGSVRLFERWVRSDPPTAVERAQVEDDIVRALMGFSVPPGIAFVGLAGTWTTLAAIASGAPAYDATLVHGRTLPRAEIAALTDRLWESPLARRRALPGLQPGRADVIPVGASIARLTMEAFALDRVTVSDRGVRWGLLYERLDRQS